MKHYVGYCATPRRATYWKRQRWAAQMHTLNQLEIEMPLPPIRIHVVLSESLALWKCPIRDCTMRLERELDSYHSTKKIVLKLERAAGEHLALEHQR